MNLIRPAKRAVGGAWRQSWKAWQRARWTTRYHHIDSHHDLDRHLDEAVAWLLRAQDHGADRGVAYGAPLGGGFWESYPETTGYIIPTFLALAEHLHDDNFVERAVSMGDWEIDLQMPCGAVMAGRCNLDQKPAVFNTGQVLLGWSALYRATGEQRFLEAAKRAVDWLIERQTQQGNWYHGDDCRADAKTTVYNVKAAWGLLEAGLAGGWDEAIEAAGRSADYCLAKQQANGWIADCCLNDASQPLLHTIAYAMQGLVGIGVGTGRSDLLDAAQRTAGGLAQLMDDEGFLPGRIDASFRGTVDWCCLTGTAQTAIVWWQLWEQRGDPSLREAAELANRYLMARHNVDDDNPAIRGGMFGSWPFWGDYGSCRVLNWANKFFIDSLLYELRHRSCTSSEANAVHA